MPEIHFLTADCGHIITAENLGGKCSKCGKLCCKNCLLKLDGKLFCLACFKEKLRENGLNFG